MAASGAKWQGGHKIPLTPADLPLTLQNKSLFHLCPASMIDPDGNIAAALAHLANEHRLVAAAKHDGRIRGRIQQELGTDLHFQHPAQRQDPFHPDHSVGDGQLAFWPRYDQTKGNKRMNMMSTAPSTLTVFEEDALALTQAALEISRAFEAKDEKNASPAPWTKI